MSRNKPKGKILIVEDSEAINASIEDSERKFRELFEKSGDAILLIENNKIIDCNPAAVKMLKYRSKEEFLNVNPSALSPLIQPDGTRSVIKADKMMNIAMKNGTHRFEWIHTKKGGMDFPVEVLLTAISNTPEKKILHTVWRDITKRKIAEQDLKLAVEEARNHRNKYRNILENLPDIAYEGDVHGNIAYLSKLAESEVNIYRNKLIGKPFTFIYHEKCHNEAQSIIKKVLKGESLEYELTLINGKILRHKSEPIRAKNGTIVGFSGLANDISEQKLFENRLNINQIHAKFVNTLNDDLTNDEPLNSLIKKICDHFTKIHELNSTGLYLLYDKNTESPYLKVEYSNLKSKLLDPIYELTGIKYKNSKVPIFKGSFYEKLYGEGRITELSGITQIVPAIRDLVGPEKKTLYKLAPQVVKLSGIQNLYLIPLIIDSRIIGHVVFNHNQKFDQFTKDTLQMMVIEIANLFKRNEIKLQLIEAKEKAEESERRLAKKNNDLKASEEEIRAYNEKLIATSDALKAANISLEKALTKAEESEELKSAFLANMSHEIRTPLNSILGFSSLLRKKDLPEEKKEQFLNLIETGGKQLLTIINDIVVLSKIDAKQLALNIEQVSLNEMIDAIYNQFSLQISSKVNFKVSKTLSDHGCFIESDPVRLTQIISNLLENAIKFTKKGQIESGYSIVNNDTIQFYVKDTGIGIAKKDMELVFKRFRQADNDYTRSGAGTGLGLSIAEGLVELLGGKMTLESEIGKGSTFYFNIPFLPVSKSVQTTNVDKKEISCKEYITILIAEDDISNFVFLEQLLQVFFKENQLSVIHAKNGLEAINLFKLHPEIDLILMDLKMPVMNGTDATTEIRKVNKSIPIIAQTAFALSDDKKNALEKGFNDYLTKPLTIEDLHKSINEHIK